MNCDPTSGGGSSSPSDSLSMPACSFFLFLLLSLLSPTSKYDEVFLLLTSAVYTTVSVLSQIATPPNQSSVHTFPCSRSTGSGRPYAANVCGMPCTLACLSLL